MPSLAPAAAVPPSMTSKEFGNLVTRHLHRVQPIRPGPDGSRIPMEVVNAEGRAEPVEFRLRSISVEVWQSEHCAAVLDREHFRAWIWAPLEPLNAGLRVAFLPFVVDEVALSVDAHHRRLRIVLPRVRGWIIAPAVTQQLRELV